MKCAWCELEVNTDDWNSVRLSNSSPPWQWQYKRTRGIAGTITSVGDAFNDAIRAAARKDRPTITLWFHRNCWDKFIVLLNVKDE